MSKGYPRQLRRIFISALNLKIDVFAVLGVCGGFITEKIAVLAMYSDVSESVGIIERNTANTPNTLILNFSYKVKFDFAV